MNSLKQFVKSIGLMAILIASVSVLQAQGGEERQGRRGGMRNLEPADMAQRQTERMTEDFALSEAQIPDVQAVNLKYAEMTKAAVEEHRGDRQMMRGVITDIRAKRMKAMKAVLTKEQYKAFRKAEIERQEARQNRGPRGEGGPPQARPGGE